MEAKNTKDSFAGAMITLGHDYSMGQPAVSQPAINLMSLKEAHSHPLVFRFNDELRYAIFDGLRIPCLLFMSLLS